jgi:hypothetical protein
MSTGNVPLSKKRKTHQPNQFYKITLCKHWLEHGDCQFGEECHYAHGEGDLRTVAPTTEDDEHKRADDAAEAVYDPYRGKMDAVMNLPYNSSTKAAYFLVHAPDLDTLARSYRSGYWGTSGTTTSPHLTSPYRNYKISPYRKDNTSLCYCYCYYYCYCY